VRVRVRTLGVLGNNPRFAFAVVDRPDADSPESA
jgi:hypothetical protein